ncbi:ATP-binding protein [Treponema sp. TIM-1]|uniref:ATP-binding protein n=1 Tax=Treponema sp. TIM-1 TaxID=2898417 RepID=UPI003980E5F7
MNPLQMYNAPPAFEKEITLSASAANLDQLLDWVETTLAAYSCSTKTCHHIMMVTEEIFINIAKYAYPEQTGEATVRFGRAGDALVLQFEDGGTPFNPLQWPAPQTGAPIEKRNIGGLGIHLVKKMTDHAAYAQVGGKNQLTIYKTLSEIATE